LSQASGEEDVRMANEYQAERIIADAGAAGGIDEIRRIAEKGWPEGDKLLRAEVQAEAKRIVKAVDAE
jgi:hypothetical protein